MTILDGGVALPDTGTEAKISKLERRIEELEEENSDLRAAIEEASDHMLRQLAEIASDLSRRMDLIERRTNLRALQEENTVAERMKKMDRFLLARRNHSATFSEIGKHLDLGKNRRQIMTTFGLNLEALQDRYEVTRRGNVKRVTLRPDWANHLRLQEETRVRKKFGTVPE